MDTIELVRFVEKIIKKYETVEVHNIAFYSSNNRRDLDILKRAC